MPPTAKPRPAAINTRGSSALRAYPNTIGFPDGRSMDAVSDEALLSAVLTMADPGVDADALAIRLLSGQRPLAEAVSAVASRTAGAGELDALAIVRFHALTELAARLVRPSLTRHPVFVEHDALVTYCRLRAACAPVQMVRLLFLDDRKHLIADEVHQTGTLGEVATYVQEIMRRALEVRACGLVVAHSTPGDEPPRPSDARNICADVQRAGSALGIELHEYLLIGRQSYRCLVRGESEKPARNGPAVADAK